MFDFSNVAGPGSFEGADFEGYILEVASNAGSPILFATVDTDATTIDIDDTDLQPGDRAWRKSKVNGHSAFLLSPKMVRITTGQTFNQRGLTVIYMTGRAECDVLLFRTHRLLFLRPKNPAQRVNNYRIIPA